MTSPKTPASTTAIAGPDFRNFLFEPFSHFPDGSALGKAAGLSKGQLKSKYSTRLMRYLIPFAWLRILAARRGRPLRIAEVGVGSGQMKKFVDFAWDSVSSGGAGALYDRWDAFDIAPQTEKLLKAGYQGCNSFDADQEFSESFADYDVVLLLHVLEHLKDPEASMRRLAGSMESGSWVVGGVPSVPDSLVAVRERQLRKKYLPGGHWCKFSSERISRMLGGAALGADTITGAFFLRWSGFFGENHLSWIRLNFALAAQFPSLPGEVYFVGSKR